MSLNDFEIMIIQDMIQYKNVYKNFVEENFYACADCSKMTDTLKGDFPQFHCTACAKIISKQIRRESCKYQ